MIRKIFVLCILLTFVGLNYSLTSDSSLDTKIISESIIYKKSSEDIAKGIYSTMINYDYNLLENQKLSFTTIMTTNDPDILLELWPVGLPPGSSMPFVSGHSSISSTFSWIPNYCQSNDYSFDVEWVEDSVVTFSDTHNIHVADVNRLPQFSTMPCYAEIRASRDRLKFDFSVTDQDQLQCGDDSLFPVTKNGIPYNVGSLKSGSPANTYTYEFRPGYSDIGTHQVKFSVSDSKGGTTTKTLTIKVIDKYAPLSTIRYACIDPVANIG
ncbi:hypothetical protein HY989_01590 [Candidatus Micrarchaeota archaeon]|nr:hypothetical protein [Candidatus Micrarchaeota archaeon]